MIPRFYISRYVWLVAGLALAVCCFSISCTRSPDPVADQLSYAEPLPDSVTFSAHIAPLIHQHCTPCHRPQSAGPFDLISYEDVVKRKKMIAHVTSTRYMPPWPADPSYRHFVGEKVLPQRAIDLIGKWTAQGGPIGEPDAVPDPPDFPTGSQLGEPDLVIRMEDAFPIKGDNRDRFLFMKLPFEIPYDTFVRAIEFVPGNAQAVHHMNGHLVSYLPERKQDVFEGERAVDREKVPVEVAYPRLGLLNDDGSYPILTPLISNYLPGVLPVEYPDGIGGFVIKRQGAILLNDLHYGPLGIDTFDQSYFNLFFSPNPPKRPTKEIQLGTLGISDIVPPLVIPPDTIMTFQTRAVIQQDISLLTINPHMHLLGKSFLAYAIPPEGDTIPLIRIPDWDFRWQYFYTFEKMLRLPSGTLIEVRATFDNTTDNPNNPYDPPQVIAERNGSMRTTDEMLQFILTYLPYEPEDEKIVLGMVMK